MNYFPIEIEINNEKRIVTKTEQLPYLQTVEGTLDEVINYAVELPNFWQWGAGGEIFKTEVKKIKVL